MKKAKKAAWERVLNIFLGISTFVFIFGFLEAYISISHVPTYILGLPSESFKFIIENTSEWIPHMLQTLKLLIPGYLIGTAVGVVLAFIFTSNRLISAAFSPYVTLLKCTPLIILVPLMMMWFGVGSKVVVIGSALSCFAIILTNTSQGVGDVSLEKKELMVSMKATKLQTFTQVLIPASLPSIFTGLRLGCIFACIGSMSTELKYMSKGLGSRVSYYCEMGKVDKCFAYIYLIIAVCTIIYSLVDGLEKVFIKE